MIFSWVYKVSKAPHLFDGWIHEIEFMPHILLEFKNLSILEFFSISTESKVKSSLFQIKDYTTKKSLVLQAFFFWGQLCICVVWSPSTSQSIPTPFLDYIPQLLHVSWLLPQKQKDSCKVSVGLTSRDCAGHPVMSKCWSGTEMVLLAGVFRDIHLVKGISDSA